jgi:sugar (pentulose or hexulose) kinase
MSPEIKATDDLFLVFDAGSQSIRSSLIDVTGRVVDSVKIPIQPYFSKRLGWAEQSLDYFWENFCEASWQIMHRNKTMAERVKAVAMSCQRGTYINLDREGKPLRPAITWLDDRLTPKYSWAPWHLEAGLKAIGWFNNLDTTVRRCYSNWIRQCQPEIWDRTHKYVLMSGYLNYMLTGNFVESLGNNFGYLPIDRRTYRWASKNDLINLVFPIERDKLPDLVAQGEILGRISMQASAATAIPEGLPLVASAGDKQCEVLGSGCLDSDVGCLSLGTCASVNTVTDSYIEVKTNFIPYPAAIPGHYSPEISVVRGFWMVSWFKEEFGLKEQMLSKERNVSAEALLDEMIAGIPTGSAGLVLQPYWSPNLWVSGEEARGSITGFSPIHTRAHLYRAILEGILYGLKDGAGMITRKLKQPFVKIRASGGGAQSKVVTQIAADIFDLPVEIPKAPETGSLGAAINAAVSLGYYPDYASAVNSMTGISSVATPIPRNRDIYSQLFNRVYKKMYRREQPLFKELLRITEMFPEEMK